MTNRIFRFDTAKTVLMACVVFCHAVTFCPGPLSVKEFARNWSFGCLVALILILATGACFSLCGIQPGFITRNVTFSASGGGFRSVQWRIAFQILYLVMGSCFLKACPTHETVLSGFGRRTLPGYLFHPYVLVPVAALIANRPELTSWPVRYALMGISALATLFFFHPCVQSLVSGMVSWPKRRTGS